MASNRYGLPATVAVILLALASSGCHSLDSAYGATPCSHLPDGRAAIDCANAQRERDEAYRRDRERAKARTDRSRN